MGSGTTGVLTYQVPLCRSNSIFEPPAQTVRRRKSRECYAWGVGTFEYFDHAADVGIELTASSLPDLFVTAARALMEWMGPAPDSPASRTEKVTVEADNLDELLVRWLQELLYLFHRCRCYWLEAGAVEVTDRTIAATIKGSPWNEESERVFQEVKAVTYHKVRVLERRGIWHARVILDI